MQHKRDGTPSRFMTSLLAVALAVFTLATPPAIASGPHDCCKRMGHTPGGTTVQCCMPARPEPPRSTPPAQGPAVPSPDLAPLLPALATPVPPVVATLVVAPPSLLVAPPPIYLLNATLLV